MVPFILSHTLVKVLISLSIKSSQGKFGDFCWADWHYFTSLVQIPSRFWAELKYLCTNFDNKFFNSESFNDIWIYYHGRCIFVHKFTTQV